MACQNRKPINHLPVAFRRDESPACGFQAAFLMIDGVLHFLEHDVPGRVNVLGCMNHIGVVPKSKTDKLVDPN